MEIVRLESVTKVYEEQYNKVNALNDISLSINKGEFIIIVGSFWIWQKYIAKYNRWVGQAYMW